MRMKEKIAHSADGHEGGKMSYGFAVLGVMLNTMTGYYSSELLPFCLEGMAAAQEQRTPFTLFFDWERMSGYDPECRKSMTSWTLARKADVACVHILVKSKLVAMGVSVANMALGGRTITAYTSRVKFEHALVEACKRR